VLSGGRYAAASAIIRREWRGRPLPRPLTPEHQDAV
jgi:hypothetical protein